MNKKQTAVAIGISTVSSAGVRRNMGTMSKGMHSGQGARFGIEAAWLAKKGFTGDPEILEAPLGFIFAMSPADERDTTAITERLAKPWALEKNPGMKDFPAVTPGHGVIDASLAVRRAHDFSVDDIDYVESDYNTFSLLRPEAHDDEEAGFCAPFMVASALVHNAFGLAQVTEKAVHNKKVQALAKKVRQIPPQVKGGNRTTVYLKDGRSFSADAPRGRRVDDWASFEKKFMECATEAISKKAATEMMDKVLKLDKQPNVKRIMALSNGR
jgi:2-methylcitrate dehydratase